MKRYWCILYLIIGIEFFWDFFKGLFMKESKVSLLLFDFI